MLTLNLQIILKFPYQHCERKEKYQHFWFVPNQLSDNYQIIDRRNEVESPLCKHQTKIKQSCNFENSDTLCSIENLKFIQICNKQGRVFEENLFSPQRTSLLNTRTPYQRVLRMKQFCNKLHKSKSQLESANVIQGVFKIRRRSEYERASDKLVRLSTLYPTIERNILFSIHLLPNIFNRKPQERMK